MTYVGDIRLGDTFDVKFCTVTTTGAPTTLAGTPVISAYVGNSLTQITAGITLTVDFDTVTGLHNVRVVASGANGYATASNYQLVITTGTVGGTSVVGYVIAQFSIENRSALIPTTAARTLDVDASGGAEVGSFQAGAITAAAFTAGAIDAAAIGTGAIDADAIATGAFLQAKFGVSFIQATSFTPSAIDADAIAAGAIDAATFAAGAINAAAIATGAIDADALAADAVDEIWDEAVEGTTTARESLRLANSANGAVTSGMATATAILRDLADTKPRVTATVDADGNRSAVTRDLT